MSLARIQLLLGIFFFAEVSCPAQDLFGAVTATDGVHLRLGPAARSLPAGTPLRSDGVQLALQGAEGVSRLSMVRDGDGVSRAAWTVEAFAEVRLGASPFAGRVVSGELGTDRLWLHLEPPPGGRRVACRLRMALSGDWTGPAGNVHLAVDHDADGQIDVALAPSGGSARLDLPLHFDGRGHDLLVEIGVRATAIARSDDASLARSRASLLLELAPAVLAAESGAGCGDPAWLLTSAPRLAEAYDLSLDRAAAPGEFVWLVVGRSRGVNLLPGSSCWLWTDPDAILGWRPAPGGQLRLEAGPPAPVGTALHVQAVGLAIESSGAIRVRTSGALRLTTL